jgi:nitrogen-specific signal transduction histidine kinase
MVADKEQIMIEAQLKVVAKILSAFSHELNNHLAVIKESAGLIEDILNFNKSFKGAGKENLKAFQSIENHITNTSWLCEQLGNFGHRMDGPLASFDVNEGIKELLVLLGRIAKQKGIIFDKDFQDNVPLIHTNPSKLQFLVFCFIDKNLNRLERNGRIIFKTSYSNSLITIKILAWGEVADTGERDICADEVLEYVAGRLRGNIVREEGGIAITLPVSISSEADVHE